MMQASCSLPRRLHRHSGERTVFVRLAKIIRRPLVLEQHHGISADVVGNARAGWQREGIKLIFFDVRRQPADDAPRRGFEARFRAVFAFEPELHYFKLQRADGGEQRRFDGRVAEIQRLDDAFLQKLLEALAELLVFSRVRIVQIRKRFRREARDFLVKNFWIRRQRVADAKAVVADETNDIAGMVTPWPLPRLTKRAL